MVLPYGMLLTRLYRHVANIQPCSLTEDYFLVDHGMVRVIRFMVDGKRPHPPTDSSLSSQLLDEYDPIRNCCLSSVSYLKQLPHIPMPRKNSSKLKGCSNALDISYPSQRRSETNDRLDAIERDPADTGSPQAPPLASPIEPLVAPKVTPPPLTTPPPAPTQPSKQPSPLPINIEPRELIFTTPPTSPHPYYDELEDLPPRPSNPPPLPTSESIERMASQPPPMSDVIDVEPPLPPLPPHFPPHNTFHPLD
ncbi:hypothetical protein Tco_0745819 [Tanacetum coccineum]